MRSDEFNMISNVVKEKDYKLRVSAVFNDVAEDLKCTLGPYGCNTIMEKSGDVMFSKDGFQVLKKIAYMDEIQNTILGLLFKIAAQVAIKVGDGTTTSIVAANQLLKHVSESNKLSDMRPKDFADTLSSLIEEICAKIQENAINIDKDGELEEIYKLAMVSTNGEEVIADMIRAIYEETGNPAIEYNISKSHQTTYEIVDGYKMKFMTYVDRIFINNDNGTCNIRNPKVLMLNHKLEQEYFETIIQPAIGAALQENKRLVVIAPYYDTHLLQKFARTLTHEFKATNTTSVVYVRASLMNNFYHDLFGDFAALLGSTILNEQTAHEICSGELTFEPSEYFGEVEEMIIGSDSTYVRGFINRNEAMIKILTDDAESKYRDVMEASQKSTILTEDFINSKQRLAKLKCSMGIINVGGFTELAKSANYDLVEDAVKACESAYLYGYVPGQTISIQTAIADMLKQQEMYTEDEVNILHSISNAFAGVTKILLDNKFGDVPVDQVNEMIQTSIENQEVIDVKHTQEIKVKKQPEPKDTKQPLVDRIINWMKKPEECEQEIVTKYDVKYSQDIINSCMTDIEILRATSSIIGLVLSSNQFIAIRV